MQKYDDFIRAFHGDINRTIFLRPYYTGRFDKNDKEIIVYYPIPYGSITHWNKTHDIYFIPNLGGTKGDQIYEITSVFIDLDAGRNPDGSYKCIERVNAYKAESLKRIESFRYKPSIIVPTRNGWHVYWLLNSSPDKAAWTIIEEKMIQIFHADKSVKKLAQLMRLPYTTWRKPHENCEPFETTIYRFDNYRYELEDFETLLQDVLIDKTASDKTGIHRNIQTDQSAMIRAIVNGDIPFLQGVLQPQGETFDNYGDFHRHITQKIDLGTLLGISPGNHCCVFHNDATPSAGLFKSDRNEWVIHCHSSNCAFFGNIRGVIEELRRCSKYQAVRFLMEVYNLEITESNWQQQQRYELQECRRFLIDDLKEFHPDLFDNIVNDLPLLYMMIDVAADNVRSEDYADEEGNPVFFVSLQKIGDALGIKDRKTVGKKIANLAFHRLLLKRDEHDIPPVLLTRAKQIAAAREHRHHASFYSIPSYSSTNLRISNERARLFQQRPLPQIGRTHEGYVRTYGEEIADEVFPQIKGKSISEKADLMTSEMHSIVLEAVEARGYITEVEILEQMGAFFKKTISMAQIKKSMHEMLDVCLLERVRLNKELKERFEITDAGWGFIIKAKDELPGCDLDTQNLDDDE